ncbi:MAG: DNA polymerase I, partial [Acidimicrobiales bacterium]
MPAAPVSPNKDGPLFLLDGMSLAYRAYFALPPELTTSAGTVTNAVHGFMSMLVYLLREHHPTALAVAFDPAGPTFRDELHTEYKAGRAETPDELVPQFDMIRRTLRSLAIPLVEAPGFEADDVLATLATQARDRACDVVVVTGDRDCFQLVEDPHVRVLYNRQGVTRYDLYDEAGILARTGVPAFKYPLLAALRGDPSDNIAGVPGVGDKTAAKLLNSYGDIDGVFSNLGDLTPKLAANLAAAQGQVRANLELLPLVRDVSLEVTVEELELGGWDIEAARDCFAELELKSTWDRIVPLLKSGALGRPVAGPVEIDETEGEPRGTLAPFVAPVQPLAPVQVEVPDVQVAGSVQDLDNVLVRLLEGAERIALMGRSAGTPGRSPLVGLAVVADGAPRRAVWIPAQVLGSDGAIASLQALAGVPVVGHEVKELMRSLLWAGLPVPSPELDIAVAHYLLDPSRGTYPLTPPGLTSPKAGGQGQLAIAETADADPPTAALTDAAVVLELVTPTRAALGAAGMLELYESIENPLIGVLARMEVAGIRVDADELRAVGKELVGEVSSLEAEIHELAGHGFNVNSTPQLRAVLYDEIGLRPARRTKTGYSTDAATLEGLRDDHPIVEALLRYRELEKLRSTYCDSLLAEVAKDGRIHASFRQTVARTGRLSSERPNLHNIPVRTEAGRRFRRVFVPAPGFSFLVADYDQVELRVLAHLSNDPGLMSAFSSGTDIHRAVAAGVYGVGTDEVTRTQRERAKMVSYGLAYGMEAYGLAQRLSIEVGEANEMLEQYFVAFPAVRSYMERTVAEARVRGYT